MFTKSGLVIVSFAFLGLALVNADESHIINDCLDPGTTPTVYYDQEVSKSGAFLQTQEETVRIPTVGFTPSAITCLTVTNMDSDDDGGYPKVMEGGVGSKYVTLNLKSQRSKGFDFRITVYYDKGDGAYI